MWECRQDMTNQLCNAVWCHFMWRMCNLDYKHWRTGTPLLNQKLFMNGNFLLIYISLIICHILLFKWYRFVVLSTKIRCRLSVHYDYDVWCEGILHCWERWQVSWRERDVAVSPMYIPTFWIWLETHSPNRHLNWYITFFFRELFLIIMS